MKARIKLLIGLMLFAVLLAIGCITSQPQDQNKPDLKEVSEMPEKIIELKDEVIVDYVGFFEDGEVFDTSFKEEAVKSGLPLRNTYEPLTVKVGLHKVIQGFEEALLGMKEGEEKTVSIPPEKAYGEKNPELIQVIEKTRFPEANSLTEGQLIQTSVGQANIIKVNEKTITLDFNHPLAGKTLNFKLIVRKITKAPPSM